MKIKIAVFLLLIALKCNSQSIWGIPVPYNHVTDTPTVHNGTNGNLFNRKLYLSLIYNTSNFDFARLKEGEYYQQLIPDGVGKFYIPQWSIYKVENGFISNNEIDDKYLNSRSFIQIITQ